MNTYQCFSIKSEDLLASITAIEHYAKKHLKDKIDKHFTDHSILHSYRILTLLDQLLITNHKYDFLNESEKYILLASVLLHDIGMQDEVQYEQQADRRENHHLVSSNIINTDYKEIGIITEYVDLISHIVKSHRGNLKDNYGTITFKTCKQIHCDLLAVLMYLGDEIDISFERVDIDRKKHLRFDVVANLHFYKHYYTQGISINETQQIIIEFRYPNGRGIQYNDFFTKIVYDKLFKTISEITSILTTKYGITISLPRSNITYKEIASIESIPATLYEQIIDWFIGVRHFVLIKRLKFKEMVGDINPKLYFNGSVRWQDIVNSLDIKRDIYGEITNAVSTKYEEVCKNQCPSILLITGEGGSGKTSLLMRLAFDTYNIENYSKFANILWYDCLQPFDTNELVRINHSTQKPLVIFIDGANLTNIFIELKNSIEKLRIPILFIFAARANEWINEGGRSLPFKCQEIPLDKLSSIEIVSLIMQLSKYNQLDKLTPLTDEERYKVFAEKAEKQLLVAMFEATKSENFDKIILNEYEKLKEISINAASAYEMICLHFSYGVYIPKKLLMKLILCGDELEFQDMVLDKTYLLIIYHKSEFGVEYYKPRHRIIAEELIKMLPQFNTKLKQLQKAIAVLNILDVIERNERYTFTNFCQAYLEDIVRGPKNDYEDRIFETKNVLKNNENRIKRLLDCAKESSHIPELKVWARISRNIGLYHLNLYTLKSIIEIDTFNTRANYLIAKQLLKVDAQQRNYDEIYHYFDNSFNGGNRRVPFLNDFLVFCLKNEYDDKIELIIDAVVNSHGSNSEEEELRIQMQAIIDGYRIKLQKEEFTDLISSLSEHVNITEKLSGKNLIEYIDLIQSGNERESLQHFEQYLLSVQKRPESVLTTIARLSSKIKDEFSKAITFYNEIFEVYIKPRQISTDYDILIEYAKFAIVNNMLHEDKIFEILRFAVKLEVHDVQSYALWAEYASNCGKISVSEGLIKKGIEKAIDRNKYDSYYCHQLRKLEDKIKSSNS